MNQDTLPIIFSYMKPIELATVRVIDRFFSERVRLYFLYCCNTSSIQEHICPICSYWLDKSPTEIEPEKRQTVELTLSFLNVHSRLFCKDCQYVSDSTYPFKGYRKYYTFTYYNTSFFPWSIVYYQDKNNVKKWEEIDVKTHEIEWINREEEE